MNSTPLISVLILNYNGAKWLERCLISLQQQTVFSQIEVIVADNLSSDGSDRLAQRLIKDWQKGIFVQHGENLGFCEGNNRAARLAKGRYIFFLNNDTWLEPSCLEVLAREVERSGAQAAGPQVLDYDSDNFQSLGALGFDICGLASTRPRFETTREIFMPEGCSFLVEGTVFEKLGGFDPTLFMYSDEFDFSWRLWVAGYSAVAVPAARLHHRGAANVNPAGGARVTEMRTSDQKRFLANRNGLLAVIKNAQHLLLLLLPFQLLLLAAEALVALLLVRRWTFVRRAYWGAIVDCWRLREHISRERQRIRQLRHHSDWWMLRFLRVRLNRWDEVLRAIRMGPPKVTEE